MAKQDQASQASQTKQAQVPAAPAAPAATKKSGAAVVLADGTRRIDYIRTEFAKGRKRGEIAKELGVPYQIVFAATKPAKATAETAPAPTPTPAQ